MSSKWILIGKQEMTVKIIQREGNAEKKSKLYNLTILQWNVDLKKLRFI